MRLLWVKNSLPLSAMIRWALECRSSHFAVEFSNGFVLHSNLLGFHPAVADDFLRDNLLIYEEAVHVHPSEEQELFFDLMRSHLKNDYGWKEIFYFSWRAILWKLFKKPLPAQGAVNSSGLLCLEVYGLLPTKLVPKLEADLTIISPDKLYELVQAAKKEFPGE